MSGEEKTAGMEHDDSFRKAEHLRINLKEDVRFKGVSSGLENYYFVHQALPELFLQDIDLSTFFLNKKLLAPLIISAMTGGTEAAAGINHNLARAAQDLGIGMGIGSQRIAIENPKATASYQVRNVAPHILLLANLGAVQLNYGYGVAQCLRAVEMIEADALVLHLNPLQEALQFQGNTDFSRLLKKIEQVARQLSVPVIVKEVGFGISEEVARKLAEAGVAGIDIAGAGGTSWSEVERHRAPNHAAHRIAAAFAHWGIPTADSLLMARKGAPELLLIASGGIRDGIDVAKTLALGADAAGIAAPLLKAAAISEEKVRQALREIIAELRIAMFCIGAADIRQLKNSSFLRRRGL